MDEFIAKATSLSWWLSVVVGSIVLHVAAIRADAWIPKAIVKAKQSWRERTRQRMQQHQARIHLLQKSPLYLQYAMYQAGLQRARATWLCVLAVALFILFMLATRLPPRPPLVSLFPAGGDLLETIRFWFGLVVVLFGALVFHMASSAVFSAVDREREIRLALGSMMTNDGVNLDVLDP
jgi:hypothetical protein